MSEKTTLEQFPVVVKMATEYGMPATALLHTMSKMAMPKDHTREELLSCLMVAQEHGLNPLTREIYFMRARNGQIQPIIGVDGWINKANSHPKFDGVDFERDLDAHGKLIGMTCRIYRKDRAHPTVIYEDLEECAKAGGPVWKTSPMRMLRNRAFCQCARIAFGLAGVMASDEFADWQQQGGAPIDITPVDQLEDAPAVPCREGGPLPNARGGRPVANAFKEAGGNDQFNATRDNIMDCQTVEDLYRIYDSFEQEGQPWFGFPWSYARMLQDEYYGFRMAVLRKSAETIDAETGEILDDAVLDVDVLTRSIANADNLDALNALWNSMTEDERDAVSTVYMDRLEELA